MDTALNPGTITLLIYIIVLVPLMLLGYYFARRKMFVPHHKLTMTAVVILNWILIGAVMATSYGSVAEGLPDNLDQNFALIPTIHGIFGLVAQLMASYLVLLMWTENTPLERIVIFRIKNIKTPMRITLSLWLITVLLGFGVYGVWYGGSDGVDAESPLPAITEEASEGDALPDPASTEEASSDNSDEETSPDPASTEESDVDNSDEETSPDPATTEES